MGNVSSRPDEGAALYLRDQSRCKFLSPAFHAVICPLSISWLSVSA